MIVIGIQNKDNGLYQLHARKLDILPILLKQIFIQSSYGIMDWDILDLNDCMSSQQKDQSKAYFTFPFTKRMWSMLSWKTI